MDGTKPSDLESKAIVACPYNDQDCPKLLGVLDVVKLNSEELKKLSRLVYIVIGMIFVNWGVLIA